MASLVFSFDWISVGRWILELNFCLGPVITSLNNGLNICTDSFDANSIASKAVFANVSLSKIFCHIPSIDWKSKHFFVFYWWVVSSDCNWISIVHFHVCLSVACLIICSCLHLSLCVLTDLFRISLNDILRSLKHIRKFFINNIKIFNKWTWTHCSISAWILSLSNVSSHLWIKHLVSIIEAKVERLTKFILFL